MNVAFHFLFNYLFVDFVIGNAWSYVIFILIFSVAIDLTHVPYLLKTGSGVIKRRFGSASRTRFHEIYGLTLLSALVCICYLFFPHATMIAALCMVLHFALDFLAGKSMPFYPYSKTEVFLHIFPYGYRNKILFEIVLTLLTGVLFWLDTASLLL